MTTEYFLVSLYDKDPYANWLSAVDKNTDYQFIGTEGTAAWCEDQGVDCTTIGEVIGLDPRLGGKVKSLHPDLYTGIMAHDPDELPEGIPYFGGVAVDLTPFEFDGELNPGKIDIGGPCLLRAAAKSWESVTVVSSPAAARRHMELIPLDEDDRRELSRMAFERTLRYDHELLPEIKEEKDPAPSEVHLALTELSELRYGESPPQDASWDRDLFGRDTLPFQRLAGDNLSYTNCLDANAARRLARPDDKLQVSVIKHANPTGWARGDDPETVIENAWNGDPKSAFGSMIGINRTVEEPMVRALDEYFVVGIIAPDFTEAALEYIRSEGTCRALRWNRGWGVRMDGFVRNVQGGYLVQSNPETIEDPERWENVGNVSISDEEEQAMRQAWKLCRWVNSNAAVIGTLDQTLGVGAGQQSRVDAVDIAVRKYHEFHEGKSDPLVLASDGFFPFPDNIERADDAGVEAIVSPGGSVRDEEVLKAAEKRDIGMVFTHTRAFYH